jgi:hypothetical protein
MLLSRFPRYPHQQAQQAAAAAEVQEKAPLLLMSLSPPLVIEAIDDLSAQATITTLLEARARRP